MIFRAACRYGRARKFESAIELVMVTDGWCGDVHVIERDAIVMAHVGSV